MTPFEPQWLIEALGVVEFDTALPHQLSFLPNDRLRIDTVCNTPEGPTTKITVLDGSQGWVLEQYLYDARRQLVVSAVAGGHRRDPATGLVLPTMVRINCPAARMEMRIDLGNVEINNLPANSQAMWTMPNMEGVPVVNMADPNFQPPMASTTRVPPLPTGRPRTTR
jgi:hypothetical protein